MRSWLFRSSLAGLLIVALGCRSTNNSTKDAGATGGAGIGGVGIGGAGVGGAGAMGGAAAAGGGGTTATAGTTGTAGTTSTAGTTGTAGAGTAGTGGAVPFYPLDMNDVTILAPLPQSDATPVLLRGTDLADDGTPLVPRALFDRLVKESELGRPILMPETHARLQLVAVRFDLCDRHLPGVCPETEDARMRLVLQPIFTDGNAQDVGFHAFYSIRNDEIAGAVRTLRDLARIAPAQAGPLRVSPALGAASPEVYAAALRTFVRRYGGEARLVRLTVNAQPEIFAQVRWELRGVEKKGDAFADITIVGATAISQSVFTAGSLGFDIKPMTDTPPGLLGAITQRTFEDADATTKRAYLATLAAVDNPLSHTAETVACVACHVSTVVMNMRAPTILVDPLTVPGRYTSKFDLSVAGGRSEETRATRALGYIARQPMISQRVVNDTAQTLAEIEARFPPP